VSTFANRIECGDRRKADFRPWRFTERKDVLAESVLTKTNPRYAFVQAIGYGDRSTEKLHRLFLLCVAYDDRRRICSIYLFESEVIYDRYMSEQKGVYEYAMKSEGLLLRTRSVDQSS
jgi:hypothetical protein